MRKIFNFFLFLSTTCVLVFVFLEIILRIYNPIPLRLKGEKIILPINQNYSFTNSYKQYDKLIIHKKNSLGFRGEELPENQKNIVKIITVGGSTTECFFVSEDKAWPQVMQNELRKHNANYWVNNAGLNGHSTFGHIILLKDIIVKLQPNYVFYLVGVNDLDRKDLNGFDGKMLRGQMVKMSDKGYFENLLLTLSNNSEVMNLAFNLRKVIKSRKQKIFVDKVLQLNPKDTLSLPNSYFKQMVSSQGDFLNAYRNRLKTLIKISQENNIKPVFITQPLLYGSGIDPISGIDLSKAKVSDVENGKLYWDKLELYNQVMRDLCNENKIPVLDLAKLMPKSSAYFFDPMHFTNEGSILVGKILAKEAYPIVK